MNCGHWRPASLTGRAGLACGPRPQPGLQGAAHLREHAAVHRHHVPRRPHPRPRPVPRRRAARQSSDSLGAVSVWESIGMFRSPARCGLSRLQGIPVSAGNRIFDRTGWRTGNRAGSLIPAKRAGNSLTAAGRNCSRLGIVISRHEFRTADASAPFPGPGNYLRGLARTGPALPAFTRGRRRRRPRA
jgi:hypothetical protein